MKIIYRSNNSGGNWWLKDEDWYNLEKAGWEIEWAKDCEFLNRYGGLKDGRWLGTLAKECSKEFASVKEAIAEFENITHQDLSDEGCSCCGSPHEFTVEYDNGNKEYLYGSEFLNYFSSSYSNDNNERELYKQIDELKDEIKHLKEEKGGDKKMNTRIESGNKKVSKKTTKKPVKKSAPKKTPKTKQH